jgi:hypothetical protein
MYMDKQQQTIDKTAEFEFLKEAAIVVAKNRGQPVDLNDPEVIDKTSQAVKEYESWLSEIYESSPNRWDFQSEHSLLDELGGQQ